jgi:regulator of RNase E activity RraB
MGHTEEQLREQFAKLQARNQVQVETILGFGADLDKRRQIDLTFWAPDENAAKIFVEACTRNEMPPRLAQGPTSKSADRRWAITCVIAASVNFMTAGENLETFILFADKFDCEYDGWGTAIVEAANPQKRPQ